MGYFRHKMGNSIECQVRRARRDYLLQLIDGNSWYQIEHTNISRFIKVQWFASIQMWISMQRQIDAFNQDQAIDHLDERSRLRQNYCQDRKEEKNSTRSKYQ